MGDAFVIDVDSILCRCLKIETGVNHSSWMYVPDSITTGRWTDDLKMMIS